MNKQDKLTLYTCGIADLKSVDRLLDVMNKNNIKTLVDVRSIPYSKHFVEFNRESLDNKINKKGYRYIYMGDKLGGRIVKEIALKGMDKVEDLLEKSDTFREGMRELYKICKNEGSCLIMCVEKKPEECHRFLAIGYLFTTKGIKVIDIVKGGKLDGEKYKRFEGKDKTIIKLLKSLYDKYEEEDKGVDEQQGVFFGSKDENIYHRFF